MEVNACVYKPVAKAMCELIHATIDTLYTEVSSPMITTNGASGKKASRQQQFRAHDSSLETVTDWQQFGTTVWSLLKHLKFQVTLFDS